MNITKEEKQCEMTNISLEPSLKGFWFQGQQSDDIVHCKMNFKNIPKPNIFFFLSKVSKLLNWKKNCKERYY